MKRMRGRSAKNGPPSFGFRACVIHRTTRFDCRNGRFIESVSNIVQQSATLQHIITDMLVIN